MLFIHRLNTIRKMYEKLPRPVSVLHYQESEIEIKIFYFQLFMKLKRMMIFLMISQVTLTLHIMRVILIMHLLKDCLLKNFKNLRKNQRWTKCC